MSYVQTVRRSAGAAIAALLLSGSLRAATFVPMSFSELVTASSTIVYGRVADVRGQWTTDRSGIESVVTLEVMTTLKGSSASAVTFVVPGGQAGRFVNVLPGLPTFSAGDLAVVFLTSRGVRLPGPTGSSQGVFRAAMDSTTGAVLVRPPVVGTAAPIVRGDSNRRTMTLAAFASAVRDVSGSRP
jgi:hypothetical protein